MHVAIPVRCVGMAGQGRVRSTALLVSLEDVVVRRERHGLEGQSRRVACDLRLREVDVNGRGWRSRRSQRGRKGWLSRSGEDGVIWEKREFSENRREREMGGIIELGREGGGEQRTAPRIVGKHVGGKHGGRGCRSSHENKVDCAAVGSKRVR